MSLADICAAIKAQGGITTEVQCALLEAAGFVECPRCGGTGRVHTDSTFPADFGADEPTSPELGDAT